MNIKSFFGVKSPTNDSNNLEKLNTVELSSNQELRMREPLSSQEIKLAATNVSGLFSY